MLEKLRYEGVTRNEIEFLCGLCVKDYFQRTGRRDLPQKSQIAVGHSQYHLR